VRVVQKDRIRFAVTVDGGAAAQLEIRVWQDRFGGWQAGALLRPQGAAAPAALGRVFRSRDRRMSVGKMVAWVRRRYPYAQPLAERGATARVGLRGGAGVFSELE
jgi:hypothetical protein